MGVLIDWSSEFDTWLDRLIERADNADQIAQQQLDLVYAELEYLQDLRQAPREDTATLKRVRQSRHNVVWRVAHPFRPGVALRLIVWFPPERPDQVVVALFAGDKASMGDVFYDSVGPRADAAIARYRLVSEGDPS